ncbi:ABC transporter ATP-binding protein [Aerophototrophica crusticola]|uniref:ABC transporter ATP-binding protein n=1 Tax=Aerophototrophica crusticola TaxID=1709002 RepID=A0A858R460_9PROT|nr:ABC transporter ATP-binding protein [Rhodospirillaceae bacterium B3]
MSMLAAADLSVSLGGAPVLRGVGLALRPGEFTALVGPNGAGKSTLLRTLAGLAPSDAGTVTLDGVLLPAVPARERGRRLAYLAQASTVHWPLTVERLVALGRLPHLEPWRRPGPADAAAIDRALSLCDVEGFRDRAVTSLSGGERARVLLARALAGDPALLLADEPVAGLDPYHQLRVMEVLRDRAAAGTGVLAVLHDLALVARFCGRVILLEAGRVVADGPPSLVLEPGLLSRLYGVAWRDLGDGVMLPWERLGVSPPAPRD